MWDATQRRSPPAAGPSRWTARCSGRTPSAETSSPARAATQTPLPHTTGRSRSTCTTGAAGAAALAPLLAGALGRVRDILHGPGAVHLGVPRQVDRKPQRLFLSAAEPARDAGRQGGKLPALRRSARQSARPAEAAGPAPTAGEDRGSGGGASDTAHVGGPFHTAAATDPVDRFFEWFNNERPNMALDTSIRETLAQAYRRKMPKPGDDVQRGPEAPGACARQPRVTAFCTRHGRRPIRLFNNIRPRPGLNGWAL